MQRTFIMIKPDGVARGLIGEIVLRFEKKGLTLVGGKLQQLSTELAHRHYGEHVEKPFFQDLVDFITSGPVFAMVWEGPDAIQTARNMIGATNPLEAKPGTIRGDYATILSNNIVHGADSETSATREINLFFDESELM